MNDLLSIVSSKIPTIKIIVLASVMLVFLFVPTTAESFGDLEILPGIAAEHAGAFVIEDVSFDQSERSIVIGDNLTEVSAEWEVSLLLPFSEALPASRAAYVLGKINPDNFVVEAPYTIVHEPIPDTTASTTVSFPDLLLGSPSTPSGTYTLAAYSYPEFKEEDPDVPYTQQDFLDWFQWNVLTDLDTYEGEVPETHAPDDFRQLIFDYTASTGPVFQECCSSVIFLPGFQGSVLKNGSDTVWPPSLLDTAADLQVLQLDQSGNPVTPGITVDGIVEKFHGISIYDGFAAYMDTLVPGTISSWESFPYDWRFPPDDVVITEDMVNRLETIALNESLTGQVTIVGHSNGGLVGKALIKALEEMGKSELVDSFVMVGTPQLGTPQAIGGLLHGEGSDMGTWYYTLVSKAEARALGKNMESAYNLLPSRAYLNTVTDPTVIFDESAGYADPWQALWGQAIGNFTELFEFLTDTGDTRADPAFADVQSPETLRSDLLTNADNFHQTYDSYGIPDSIRVVQVAGWGLDTIKRIEYREYEPYDFPYYVPVTTVEGDFTVVYPSALSSEGEKYFFNLQEYIKDGNPFVEHKDILNNSEIQNIIQSVIDESSIAVNSFISIDKPLLETVDDKLLVAVHSPLTLGAYDSQGRFTGVDPTNNPNWGIQFITKDIPNSTYLQYGEGKYLILPEGDTYSFEFEGTGAGTATIELQALANDEPTTTAVYSNIPVAPTAQAQLTVDGTENPEITLDLDGDGGTDQIIAPDGEELSLEEIMALLKAKVNGLDVKERLKKKFLKRVERLERKIEKNKQKNARVLANLEKRVTKKSERGKIASVDAEELLELIILLEAQSEQITLDQALLNELRAKVESLEVNVALKWNLNKKINKLEKKYRIINTLSRFTKNVIKKSERGRIADEDAQELINLVKQIESQL